jgi:hypothetical protein
MFRFHLAVPADQHPWGSLFFEIAIKVETSPALSIHCHRFPDWPSLDINQSKSLNASSLQAGSLIATPESWI